MKRIHKAVFFLFFFLVIGLACNEKALDVPPLDPTEINNFSTEAGFTKSVFGIYAKLTDWFNYNGGEGNIQLPVMAVLPGDDVTRSVQDPFEHFGSLAATDGRNSNFFATSYQIVSRANTVLQKIAEENGVYTTSGLKSYHKGEALFLRGLAFYYLWNFYGKAPVITQRITDAANLAQPESTGTQLLDQAINDFKDAATLLPTAWAAGDRGRATKNSALGMQGKSLVFRGTVSNKPADYTEALNVFNQISGVSLTTNFNDNFDVAKENNQESLFEFQASTTKDDNVWLPAEFNPVTGKMSAYYGLFSNHWSLFGAAPYEATVKLINSFTPGDPRRVFTVDSASKVIKKYTIADQASSSVGSVNNPRILRYADVLLLKAEATLQSGGSTSAAIQLINDVRTRARGAGSVPANYPTTETNKTTIMGWIMNERFLELAAEGQRWFDLRRWHIAGYITLNNAFFSATNAAAMNFQLPKHLLMPIPRGELEKNPKITQNPGY